MHTANAAMVYGIDRRLIDGEGARLLRSKGYIMFDPRYPSACHSLQWNETEVG